LVQFSILDSRNEARSSSRKPRTHASGLRRAQLSRSSFCLRRTATPPFTANPSRAGDTEAHSSPIPTTKLQPRATPRRPPRMPQVCPRAPAAPPSHVSLPGAYNALDPHSAPLRRVDFSRLSRCPSSHSCFRPDRGRPPIVPLSRVYNE